MALRKYVPLALALSASACISAPRLSEADPKEMEKSLATFHTANVGRDPGTCLVSSGQRPAKTTAEVFADSRKTLEANMIWMADVNRAYASHVNAYGNGTSQRSAMERELRLSHDSASVSNLSAIYRYEDAAKAELAERFTRADATFPPHPESAKAATALMSALDPLAKKATEQALTDTAKQLADAKSRLAKCAVVYMGELALREAPAVREAASGFTSSAQFASLLSALSTTQAGAPNADLAALQAEIQSMRNAVATRERAEAKAAADAAAAARAVQRAAEAAERAARAEQQRLADEQARAERERLYEANRVAFLKSGFKTRNFACQGKRWSDSDAGRALGTSLGLNSAKAEEFGFVLRFPTEMKWMEASATYGGVPLDAGRYPVWFSDANTVIFEMSVTMQVPFSKSGPQTWTDVGYFDLATGKLWGSISYGTGLAAGTRTWDGYCAGKSAR